MPSNSISRPPAPPDPGRPGKKLGKISTGRDYLQDYLHIPDDVLVVTGTHEGFKYSGGPVVLLRATIKGSVTVTHGDLRLMGSTIEGDATVPEGGVTLEKKPLAKLLNIYSNHRFWQTHFQTWNEDHPKESSVKGEVHASKGVSDNNVTSHGWEVPYAVVRSGNHWERWG